MFYNNYFLLYNIFGDTYEKVFINFAFNYNTNCRFAWNIWLFPIQPSYKRSKIEQIQSDENYVKYEDLPQNYLDAVVSVEDRRFYDHGAIDLRSIGRAIYVNVTNFDLREGGSTITQQLAKNIYFIDMNPFSRKLAEIFMAFAIEDNYSKEEILELYVNTSYFGDGYYGIKEACNGYLDKEPSEMDLNECTMMAGIPNAPSVYAPTKNPDLTKSRQEHVLETMVGNGYISQEEADEIINANT